MKELTLKEWTKLSEQYHLLEIARIIGSNKSTVRRKLNELGLNPLPYKQSQETRNKRSKTLLEFAKDNPGAVAERCESMIISNKDKKGKTLHEIYGKDAEEVRANLKAGHSYRIGKTFEEIFGEGNATTIRNKMSDSHNGRIHSAEAIKKMSQTRKRKIASGEIKLSPKAGCGKGGFKEDIGHYIRSRYEHYFARELKKQNIKYKYEPEVFDIVVDDIQTTYTPDFLIDSVYYEIKNSYNATLETFIKKLNAFREKYPEKKVIVVIGSKKESDYSEIIDNIFN